MKKQITTALAVLGMAVATITTGCSKENGVRPMQEISLLEGRSVMVQTSDTTFVLVAPMAPQMIPGRGLVLQNMSGSKAVVKAGSEVIELGAGGVEKRN